VRWYITYRLWNRDLVEMMAERGIRVAHSTILRWVTGYVPEFECRISSDWTHPISTFGDHPISRVGYHLIS
jgi:transposase-like protein